MPTQAGIVNDALQLTGEQVQITGSLPNFDGSPAGLAAGALYTPALQLLLREMDPDFARTSAVLAIAAPIGIVNPFAYEYAYPATCLRARQIAPPNSGTGALADPYDPQPVRGIVAYDATFANKVILTGQQNAVLWFTTSAVAEALFDAGFAEALSRRLANPLAMALAGRPDFARELLEESERYASLATTAEEL